MRGGVLETHGEGVFKICDEPRSPNEGGVFRIYGEPDSPNRGRGVFQIYDEPESPHEGACLRYIMMSRGRHMKRRV